MGSSHLYKELTTIFFLIISSLILLNDLSAQSDSLRIVEMENQIQALQEKTEGINWPQVLSISGIAGVLFLLIGWAFKSAVEKSQQAEAAKIERKIGELEREAESRIAKAEKKILESINEKGDVVHLAFEKTSEEQALLQTKRILVWGESDLEMIKRVLRRAGFNLNNLFTTEEETEKVFDILLINNTTGSKTPREPQIEKSKRPSYDFSEVLGRVSDLELPKCIFYYNETFVHFPRKKLPPELQDRINFATNPAQLYGNLLNTLKYQQNLAEYYHRQS